MKFIFYFLGILLIIPITLFIRDIIKDLVASPVRRNAKLPIYIGLGTGLLAFLLINWFVGIIVGLVIFYWMKSIREETEIYRCPRCKSIDTRFEKDTEFYSLWRCNECGEEFIGLEYNYNFDFEPENPRKAKHEDLKHRCRQCTHYREHLSRCQRNTKERPVISPDTIACGYFTHK